MEEVKSRVKSWLASGTGHEYVLEVVSERHIILTKAKHDVKIFCCYPCIISMIGVFVIVFIAVRLPPLQAVYLICAGCVTLVGLTMVIAAWQFFLNPKKVVFELKFSETVPIGVTIHSSSNYLSESRYEYDSLSSAVRGISDNGDLSLS
jgi:hypothetical protein